MNNSVGWIRLSRNIVDMDGYFGEKFTRVQCWIDLLLLAEWLPERSFYHRGIKVTIKRGQIAISVRELCERWGWSNKTVIDRLNEFEKDERISISRSRLMNIITIVNYDKYQDYTTEYTTKSSENQSVSTIENLSITQQTPQQIPQQSTQQTPQPYNNIKNINNNNTLIGARDLEKISSKEQWRMEVENDQIFWEQTAMSFSCNLDWLKSLLSKFHSENIACDFNEHTFNDYRRDFFNYARRENQNRLRNANQGQSKSNSGSRSGGSSASIGGHGLNE